MRRVTFTVRYPRDRAHPIHRRIIDDAPVTRMDLLNWGPTATVTSLAWYDASGAVVREILADVEAIGSPTLVAGDGGTYAFTTQSSFALDPAVMDVVECARVAFVPPVTFHEDGTARFVAVGEQAALAALYESLRAELPTEIERVADFQGAGPMDALTDRQRSALTAAVAEGYYEVPRTASVADVAGELDCAESTAGELLRKAERAVLTTLVDGAGQPTPRVGGW